MAPFSNSDKHSALQQIYSDMGESSDPVFSIFITNKDDDDDEKNVEAFMTVGAYDTELYSDKK